MRNTTQPKPNGQDPFGIRVGVWLFMLGLALVGIAAIGVSRRASTTFATADLPQSSDASTPLAESGASSVLEPLHQDRRLSVAPQVPEPVYQGRRLSEWIEDLKIGDFKTKAAAQDALVGGGSQTIPALAELLGHPQAANAAAWALARIGKDALPVLLDALTNGTRLAKLEVAGAMAWFGPDTEEVVPALVECLRHEDSWVRCSAIASLQAIPKRPDIAVPALTACLSDADVYVRGNAATTIRNFGHDAQPAISDLVRLARRDPDQHVRTRAAESLRVIAPEIADREGL